VSQQAYDVYIHLHLPRSPPNLAAGNFMLDLSLMSPDSAVRLNTLSETDILAHSRRPAILTYTSPLLNTVGTIAEAPLLLLGLKREAEMLDVRMMEGVEFARGWRNVPKSLRLEVQADGKMQVYSVRVKFVARFGGLRYASL
jgi:seipin